MSLHTLWRVRIGLGLALLGVFALFVALVLRGVLHADSVMPTLISLAVGGVVLALPWGAPRSLEGPVVTKE